MKSTVLDAVPPAPTTEAPSQPDAASASNSERIGYLDGWRGLAIALVLEAHFFKITTLDTGRFGVDVFFCLSGFLMSGLLFVKRQPLPIFYKRRASRVLPEFLLFVLVAYVFAYFQGVEFRFTEVASTLLFLRTYFPADVGIWATSVPIGHLWSLNIEEHCYILMSLMVLLRRFRGNEGVILLAAGVACMVIGALYFKMGEGAPHWGRLGTEVAASHLLLSAGYRLIQEKYSLNPPRYLPLLCAVLVPFCYLKAVPWWSASLLSPLLLAFSINHTSQNYEWFKAVLSTPILRWLGAWSFSLYLWQQPFYMYKSSFPGGSMMALTATFAVSLLCFYAWEQPARSWLNKRW